VHLLNFVSEALGSNIGLWYFFVLNLLFNYFELNNQIVQLSGIDNDWLRLVC